LSRHRNILGSVHLRRSRTVALIAAGAVTVAAAATAAAWTPGPSGPSGSTAGRTHKADAGSLLTVTGQPLALRAFQQSTASQAVQAYQVRDAAAELADAHWQTARRQAAKKAAAARIANAQSSAVPAQPAAQPIAAAQPSPSPTVAAPAASAASGSPQQIAEAMLGSFGWSSSQFSCLDPLWAHESGWSVTAANPDGAYGIPQALPGSKMASAGPDWQTDAATQIRWGLEYIQATYGSPCGAWAHEQATGWY
jgi:hypothetical protein